MTLLAMIVALPKNQGGLSATELYGSETFT
jgi:hypothetical protein